MMMKRQGFIILAVLLGIAFFSCTSRQEQKALTEPYAEGKPYTRWWWFASEIQQEDIKYQLEWLKENGFGGVEIAWVYPMRGDSTIKHPKWLSEEWAASVN